MSRQSKRQSHDKAPDSTVSRKPSAVVPLASIDDSKLQNTKSSKHPFRHQIIHMEYPAHMFVPSTPVPPLSINETPPTWVSTPSTFAAMLTKLRRAKEIAIDLEHSSSCFSTGFLCLMQISDRTDDWLVDLMDPVMRKKMRVLDKIFTDPGIVKVFHGASSDVVWLRENFNLHIVNLFDTYEASQILELPTLGLAGLMAKYCDFTTDKKYQRADWTTRPLPAAMLLYAQSDTHFLLYLYDELRNALLEKGASLQSTSSLKLSTPIAGNTAALSTMTPTETSPLVQCLLRSAETSLRSSPRPKKRSAKSATSSQHLSPGPASRSGLWQSVFADQILSSLSANKPGR